jgi:oxygen-dependent protoporphyrinogen oxidase
MPRIVIIGGGLSGLAAAFRLRQQLPSAELVLLERQSAVGGNIGTDHVDGFTVERGPNGIFDAKPHTNQLCRDLGLGDQLIPASEGSRKNRFLFVKGKLHRLPADPLSLLRTPVLSLRGRLAMLAEPFRRRPKQLPEDESVAAFARRRFGQEAADVFIDALVTGIHAGDPERLSVRAAFPRLPKFEAECGSVIRGFLRAAKERRKAAEARGEKPQPQRMWSFCGGLQVMIDALKDHLGSIVHTGLAVKRLEKTATGWLVRGDGSDSWLADVVVLTTPAYHQAEVLTDLDAELAAEISGIRYNVVSVVALGYREADAPIRPDGFGYIAPQNTRRDVLGVQWCSSTFPDRAPPGFVLWRALCGGVSRPDVATQPDDQLLKIVHTEMKVTMGVTAEPAFTRIIRWPKAIPQYELGHPQRVERIEAMAKRHRGLFLGGNAYHGVAMSDCTEQAERIAVIVKEAYNS